MEQSDVTQLKALFADLEYFYENGEIDESFEVTQRQMEILREIIREKGNGGISMTQFIEVTIASTGKKKTFNARHIISVTPTEKGQTLIQSVGETNSIRVDESYQLVKSMLGVE